MKRTISEKKTILIGLIGVIAMFASIVLSFECAVVYQNYMPLIVFITTCMYAELKETYIKRRDKEDNNTLN
jgi:hypothetical protein